MKYLVIGALVLASILTTPLAAALLVAPVMAPAAGHQLRAQPCTSPVPVTGDWRPPFQQPYALTAGFDDQHPGVDLVSQPGPGPVVAASTGTVVDAGHREGTGNTVEIDHGDAVTRYAHLASIEPGIKPGAPVGIGEILGVQGATGTSTTRLFFQVLLDGAPVDPVPFLAERGAPLNGAPMAPSPPPGTGPPADEDILEGGVGFPLPQPGQPRQDSMTTPAVPVPPEVKDLYAEAAENYVVPWTVLAGIGMAETAHGQTTAESPAGARGLMQLTPTIWRTTGVDGDGDGIADIDNDADSVHSAANYLTTSGVTTGPQGVRDALLAYHPADAYVNDVLFYAHAYGGGTVWGDPTDCGGGQGDPDLPPLTDQRIKTMLEHATGQVDDHYFLGATGPGAWDCSSFTQHAYAGIGITLPRTARAQRDWLAAGNGFRVPVGQAQPGDLVFWDSYLGPNVIGHVMIVWDPAAMGTIEARIPTVGYYDYAEGPEKNIFEVWRVGNIADQPGPAP